MLWYAEFPSPKEISPLHTIKWDFLSTLSWYSFVLLSLRALFMYKIYTFIFPFCWDYVKCHPFFVFCPFEQVIEGKNWIKFLLYFWPKTPLTFYHTYITTQWKSQTSPIASEDYWLGPTKHTSGWARGKSTRHFLCSCWFQVLTGFCICHKRKALWLRFVLYKNTSYTESCSCWTNFCKRSSKEKH